MLQESPRRMPAPLALSMYLAWVGGFLVPALETIRRWDQLSEPAHFLHWFDDYLIGGFLLFAAWKVLKFHPSGQKVLAAAWGFAAGMAFSSLGSQLNSLDRTDPSALPSATVAIIKGVLLLSCLAGLGLSLRDSELKQ